MKILFFFKLFCFIFIFFVSCNKDNEEKELELLLQYIENNEIETEPLESGLYYIEVEQSNSYDINSKEIEQGDTVIISYNGYLLSDSSEVFDEKDYDNPGIYVYKEDNVIQGWEEAIAYMKKGISAKIIIPSYLAYGEDRVGVIMPYSTLIFDLSIIDVR